MLGIPDKVSKHNFVSTSERVCVVSVDAVTSWLMRSPLDYRAVGDEYPTVHDNLLTPSENLLGYLQKQ